MQHIGEGTLDIPESWHNQSVNIYTVRGPGQPGPNITVNRDWLPFKTDIDSYLQEQLGKLAKQLKDFTLISTTRIEVDGCPAGLVELKWETSETGPVHQLLLCVANGDYVLSITASLLGVMNEGQKAELGRMLKSFRFISPPVAGSVSATTPT